VGRRSIRARATTATWLVVPLGLTLLVANGPLSPSAGAAERSTGRVAGADRIETAVRISQRAFPSGAEVAYLARSDVFADALAAGTLSDGPVLLVPRCGAVPDAVGTELARLSPAAVLALGGPSAVCDELLATAGAGRETGRVAGPSRFETAVRIAQRAFPDGAGEVYLASAADSPDAVAGGSLTGGPILLVPREGSPPDEVRAEIARLAPSRVVALGGTAAIGDQTVTEAAGGRPTARLAGRDRYETAARIAEYQFGPASVGGSLAEVTYLARGDVFADAVAAGSLSDGPILLVPSCSGLPDSVAAQVQRLSPASVLALGGPGAVCDATLGAAGSLPTPGVVIPDTTVILDAAGRAALRSDQGGVLVFDASGAPNLEPGDVLVSYEVPGIAPQGLLRRVTGVVPDGDQIRVTTEPASLTDAVHEGELAVDVPLTRADLVGAKGPLAARQQQATVHLIDLDRLASTQLAPGVTISGALTYDATLEVDVDVDLLPTPHVARFTTALATEETVDLTLTADGAASWTPDPVTLWEGEFRCFWMAIGPVPVALCPYLTMQLTASGKVEGRITVGASQRSSARFGAEYADGDWSAIDEHDESHTFTPPAWNVQARASAGVRGELGLEVYDLAGPYVWGTLYVRGERSVTDTLTCVGLYAGVTAGIGAGVDEDVFGDDLEIPELQVLQVETPLHQSPTPYAACKTGGARQGPSWYGTVRLTFDAESRDPREPQYSYTHHAEAVVHLTGEVASYEFQNNPYDVVKGVALSGSESMYTRNDYYRDATICTRTSQTTSGALGPNEELGYFVKPSAAAATPVFSYIGVEWDWTIVDHDTCDSSWNDTYTMLGSFGWHTDFEAPTVVAVPGGRRICDTIVQSEDRSSGTMVDHYTITATFELADGSATPDCA
jgi:putative cell wall-binding protein